MSDSKDLVVNLFGSANNQSKDGSSVPDSKLDWNFKLLLDEPRVEKEEPLPEIPPRQIIKDKFPRISTRIEKSWGSSYLQEYLGEILFKIDRSDRQGFPPDVLSALMKIHAEHSKVLEARGYTNRHDIWEFHDKK